MRMQQEYQNCEVVGISELNRNWTKIRAQDSYRNRTKRWWTLPKTEIAWIEDNDWPSEYQQGGVALTIHDTLAPYVKDKGKDVAGLGRWVWMTLEGRSERKTAIIQI